ncbi:hypothetical protein D3C84_1097860 [compost metagenome]
MQEASRGNGEDGVIQRPAGKYLVMQQGMQVVLLARVADGQQRYLGAVEFFGRVGGQQARFLSCDPPAPGEG